VKFRVFLVAAKSNEVSVLSLDYLTKNLKRLRQIKPKVSRRYGRRSSRRCLREISCPRFWGLWLN